MSGSPSGNSGGDRPGNNCLPESAASLTAGNRAVPGWRGGQSDSLAAYAMGLPAHALRSTKKLSQMWHGSCSSLEEEVRDDYDNNNCHNGT